MLHTASADATPRQGASGKTYKVLGTELIQITIAEGQSDSVVAKEPAGQHIGQAEGSMQHLQWLVTNMACWDGANCQHRTSTQLGADASAT